MPQRKKLLPYWLETDREIVEAYWDFDEFDEGELEVIEEYAKTLGHEVAKKAVIAYIRHDFPHLSLEGIIEAMYEENPRS